MLKRLQIRNFRGFNALEIDQLSGINLIAGKITPARPVYLRQFFCSLCAADVAEAIERTFDISIQPTYQKPCLARLFVLPSQK